MTPAQLYVIHTGLMATPLLQIQGAQRAQTSGNFLHILNYTRFPEKLSFCTTTFSPKFPLLQMIIVLHPSRIRHNGDTGADVQQGPAQRFLFRLRPCVNLFYCLLLTTSPGFRYNRGGGWRLGMWPRQNFCTYLDTRFFFTKGSISACLHKDRIP